MSEKAQDEVMNPAEIERRLKALLFENPDRLIMESAEWGGCWYTKREVVDQIRRYLAALRARCERLENVQQHIRDALTELDTPLAAVMAIDLLLGGSPLTDAEKAYASALAPAAEEEARACGYCARGDEPVLLDENGTLSSVSGRPGRPGHAVDDFFWFCDEGLPAPETKEE